MKKRVGAGEERGGGGSHDPPNGGIGGYNYPPRGAGGTVTTMWMMPDRNHPTLVPGAPAVTNQKRDHCAAAAVAAAAAWYCAHLLEGSLATRKDGYWACRESRGHAPGSS